MIDKILYNDSNDFIYTNKIHYFTIYRYKIINIIYCVDIYI